MEVDRHEAAKQITRMKNQFTWILVGIVCFQSVVLANTKIQRLRFLYERDVSAIEAEFERVRLSLPTRHMTVLRNMAAYYQERDDKSNLTIVKRAMERFVEDPTPAGLMPALQGPDVLLRLQASYREEFAKSGRERAEQLSARQDEYLEELTELRAELLQEGLGDDVDKVDELLAGITPVAQPGPQPAPRPEPAPSAVPEIEISVDGAMSPVPESAARIEPEEEPEESGSSGMTFDDLLEGL
jgi:hypothetical protein